MTLLGLTATGVLAGAGAKFADESTVRWLADLGTEPALWLLAAALIGRFAGVWQGVAAGSALSRHGQRTPLVP